VAEIAQVAGNHRSFRGVLGVHGQQAAASSFFDPARRRSLGIQQIRNPWVRAFRNTVWHRLPRPVRRVALRAVLGRNRPVATGAPAVEPICVVGILSTQTGIGEGGRLAGRAFTALGYDVLSVDISDILTDRRPSAAPPPMLESGAGTVVLHFNPDNLSAILTLLGRRHLVGKRIVGYWAWELPRIPEHWLPALAEVDEVWTPSRFVADAVREFTKKPVRVVPHPVAQGRTGSARRTRFGTQGCFTALVMFSFASSFERKNPVAAVQAFRRAFGDADDRLLILKASDAHEAPEQMAELLAAIGDAPNIRIEQARLSDAERLDLIASVDVLLSLHRSEGFGLVMAEAMLAGVPVIATRWSGNMDYMDERTALLVPARLVAARDRRGTYGSGESWADPDVEAAAAHLAALAADPAAFAPMRERARATAVERLGISALREAVAGALASAEARTPDRIPDGLARVEAAA
jgi:glycosyltransferase involved in cell wall biosynthesis